MMACRDSNLKIISAIENGADQKNKEEKHLLYFLLGLLTGIILSAVGIIILAVKVMPGGKK